MGMLQSRASARTLLHTLARDFACIENPGGVFPPRELVPLGPVLTRLPGAPAAVLLDMDGTVTQTEPLFLHGVEAVVRRVTGWAAKADWPGLDPARDYPHIVGFSTLRNLEYLYDQCRDAIQPDRFFRAALEGLVFLHTHDSPRETVRWLDGLTEAYGLEAWRAHAEAAARREADTEALVRDACARYPVIEPGLFANLGLIIFHADYIEAIEKVNRGAGADVSRIIHGDPDIPAVGPMPGIALLCALVKGWIPPSAAGALADHVHEPDGVAGPRQATGTLEWLSRHFHAHPIPVGLVTSSGTHEASLVLRAVFQAMIREVRNWPIDRAVQDSILWGFDTHEAFFDAMVTCDDVAGGRTKPFRDPYTLALAKLGLDADAARRVIGFEDTEAGIIAQRGAGIGVACAVPIEHTRTHDFSAAAYVLHGGIPEAVFEHRLFMP